MKKITQLILFLVFCIKLNAQGVSGYAFTESTETYTAVIGGTNSSANGDDGTDDNNLIGFIFNFGGTEYTTFSLSVNGFIRLGSDLDGNNYVNALGNEVPQTPLIAAFWDDHNRNTGSIRYLVTGTAPSRVLEIGWNNINLSNGGNASAGFSGSFKMRLFETIGKIEFVYGPAMTSAGAITASVGLNDQTSFLSVTPLSAGATISSLIPDNNIIATDALTGKKYIFLPQPQCSGAPNPGNTVASVATICPDVPFTLSLQNMTNEFGVSFQWQNSPNGTTYTDIVDEQSSTLTTIQNATTWYQCAVTCAGVTTISSPVQVVSNIGNCYCFPNYNFGKTDGDLISNVVIAGTMLSNNSGAAPVNPFYTFFTGQPNYTATLAAGTVYDVSVTVGTYGQQNVAAWIDYNDDYVFTIDERVGYTNSEIDSNGTGVFTITLACDPPAGVHRMRIRDVWNTAGETIDPCATYGYGETEDYDITIEAGAACPLPYALDATNVNASSGILVWNNGCGQVYWDVHVTIAGGGIPVGAPLYTNVSSPLTIGGLDPMTDYEFYVMANCGSDGNSGWAGPFYFTTQPMAVPNDECATSFALNPGSSFDEFALVATNAGATKTIGTANPTCANFAFGGDVWFSIIVPADGNLTVETQSDPGSPLIDTGLNVFTGACGSLTPLGCSDDEGVDAFSRLNLTGLMPGSTVYARVWEYANDVVGTFRVSAWNTSLGLSDQVSDGIRYYPNPVKDVLKLTFDNQITAVTIFNILGQQVLNLPVNATTAQIDMVTFPKGAYIVKVTSEALVRTLKIIKE